MPVIGIRHEKIADLKTLQFQLTHDLAVAHKYKNKMPFNELAVNTTFSFDKSGNIKETKFYRFKYESDYKYAKLFINKGTALTITDIHPIYKPLSTKKRTDLINKLNYLNAIFTKQDKTTLKNSIAQYDNTAKLARWYIQQSKNKKQSYKKITGKSVHKSLKPFMRTVIFAGDKEDIQKINSMSESEYNQTIINYMQKLQQKYGIQQDSITITTHNDEVSRHTHVFWHNWNDRDKKYLNNDMSSPEVMREHLNLLEEEFAQFELKKRTEYTKYSRKKHKTYAEHLTETEIKTNQANKKLAELHNNYQSTMTSYTNSLDNAKEQINSIKTQYKEVINSLALKHSQEVEKLNNIHSETINELEHAKLIRVVDNAKISNQVNLRYKHIEIVAEELSQIATDKVNSIIKQIEVDNNIQISETKKLLYKQTAKISKNEVLNIFCELIANFKQVFNKIQSIIMVENHSKPSIEHHSQELQ